MTKVNAAAAKPVVDASVFSEIHAAEAAIGAFKGAAKEQTAAANERKVRAYATLIASLSGQKLVKGNLPRAVSNAVRTGLMEDAGLKEATAKRYLENSVGALRELDIPTQATPELVADILASENITSENQLAKRVSGEADKDTVRNLAEALVGKFTQRKDKDGNKVQGVFKASKLDQEDWDRFDDMVRELKAARIAAGDAALSAAAEAKAENDMANEVFNNL
jgi:hypothetical protein